MTQDIQIQILVMSPLALVLLSLILTAVVDSHMRFDQRLGFVIIAILTLILIVTDYVDYYYSGDGSEVLTLTLNKICGFTLYPLISMMLIRTVKGGEGLLGGWLLVAVNFIVYATAFFSDLSFSYDYQGRLIHGPLFYFCYIISAILLYWLMTLTARIFNRERISETLVPIFALFFVGAATAVDSILDFHFCVRFLSISIVVGSISYYIWLHLQLERQHEQALLAEQRIKIMMSQIQPHFLFNTLSTIQALCMIDPEKAAQTTEKFGQYLRQNLDSLDKATLIPIDEDLKHTNTYVEIEKIRFPNIDVEYKIEEDDFKIPALTIQPMVENAIRHGVRGMEHGIVTVQTFADGDDYVIVIHDNGKGFDIDRIYEDKKTHIGIRNVRERIEMMCGGTLAVDSHIGEGTTITIRVPSGKDVS